MNKIMRKYYFEPKSAVIQLQGAMSQCQSTSPTNPNVINAGGDAGAGILD